MKAAVLLLIFLTASACSNSGARTNAGILCAQIHSGEGYNACVNNALKFR